MSIRLPADVVLGLTQAECQLLAPHASEWLATRRRNGLGTDAMSALMAAITEAAYTDIGGSAADRLVDGGQNPPIAPGSDLQGETLLSTTDIAERLGLPTRKVTKMLKENRVLHGYQHVPGGNWWTPAREVAAYLRRAS
jgi:hypothetical protein